MTGSILIYFHVINMYLHAVFSSWEKAALGSYNPQTKARTRPIVLYKLFGTDH